MVVLRFLSLSFNAAFLSSGRSMRGSPVSSSSIFLVVGFLPLGKGFGGKFFTWHERPLSLCTHRPVVRSSRILSGTSKARTHVTAPPAFARILSRVSAYKICEGKKGEILGKDNCSRPTGF